MKKPLNTLLLALLALLSSFFVSCKDDIINPDQVSTTGTVSFINNSSNPYNIFINDSYEFQMNGESYRDRTMSVGYYIIRVEQVSGYVLYPTVQTYSVNLSADGKEVVSFP